MDTTQEPLPLPAQAFPPTVVGPSAGSRTPPHLKRFLTREEVMEVFGLSDAFLTKWCLRQTIELCARNEISIPPIPVTRPGGQKGLIFQPDLLEKWLLENFTVGENQD